MDKGKRLAVLVGCNYPNTKNELHGCHNDILAMRDVLINRFHFDPNNIELLTDKPGCSVMPTGANIMKALNRMVDGAVPGDVLYFHYSGHGTLIDKPSFLPFYKGEAIVPTDFNLITNVDFRNLVNRVPKGATFTILSDSCHSGGLIDKEKEQIGPSSYNTDGDGDNDDSSSSAKKPKAIPLQSILEHLSSLTNISTNDIGTHLLEIFGADASLRFRLSQVEIIDQFKPLKPDEGILLSGCQTDETSADVGSGGKAFGAFSNAVQQIMKQHLEALNNREVVAMARKILSAQGFEQHPCLYCSDENANANFLCQSANSSI